MKICFITTGNIQNIATSKRALGMANPLDNLDWEVHIVMEDNFENRTRVKMECNNEIKVHYYKKTNALIEVIEKHKIVKHINPDYLFICAFVFRNIVWSGKKCIRLVEHSELQSGILDIKGFKRMLVRILEIYSMFYAHGLLCASKYLTTHYQKKATNLNHNIPILYFPYAYSSALNKPITFDNLPDYFKTLYTKKNIVFLGSITDNYGAFTMLKAAEIINRKRNDIRLILLGKGRHYSQATEYIKQYELSKTVLMPGYVEEEDIARYFSIASIFLSPMNDTIQDWARCPSKLYMYLPFGKPVVSCKIGEPYEVLGDKGYYFNVGNAEMLASLITEIIDNNYTTNANADLHSWEYRTNQFNTWIKQHNFK